VLFVVMLGDPDLRGVRAVVLDLCRDRAELCGQYLDAVLDRAHGRIVDRMDVHRIVRQFSGALFQLATSSCICFASLPRARGSGRRSSLAACSALSSLIAFWTRPRHGELLDRSVRGGPPARPVLKHVWRVDYVDDVRPVGVHDADVLVEVRGMTQMSWLKFGGGVGRVPLLSHMKRIFAPSGEAHGL
jgi:hypothetical protein